MLDTLALHSAVLVVQKQDPANPAHGPRGLVLPRRHLRASPKDVDQGHGNANANANATDTPASYLAGSKPLPASFL